MFGAFGSSIFGPVTKSSNPSPSPTIYGPRPRARVEVQTRCGTRLQSYIRPACRASDEAPGLDGFSRASFSISLAASRALVGDRVWKRRSDWFTISVTQRPYATLARAAFSATSVLEYAQSCRPCSLNRGRNARVQSCGRGYPGRAVTVTSGEQRPRHPCILVAYQPVRHDSNWTRRTADGLDSLVDDPVWSEPFSGHFGNFGREKSCC
jgi:hypothetical protein